MDYLMNSLDGEARKVGQNIRDQRLFLCQDNESFEKRLRQSPSCVAFKIEKTI